VELEQSTIGFRVFDLPSWRLNWLVSNIRCLCRLSTIWRSGEANIRHVSTWGSPLWQRL